MTNGEECEIHRLHINLLLVSVPFHHSAQFTSYWSPLSTGKMKDETLMTPVGKSAEGKNGEETEVNWWNWFGGWDKPHLQWIQIHIKDDSPDPPAVPVNFPPQWTLSLSTHNAALSLSGRETAQFHTFTMTIHLRKEFSSELRCISLWTANAERRPVTHLQ